MARARPFPTLGPPDRLGRRGMFIGEIHNEMIHMQRLLMTWSVLSAHIDVMFVEHLDSGEIPPTSSVAAAREALARASGVPPAIWAKWRKEGKREDHPPTIHHMMPDHLLRLAQAAKRTGTPLRGIDVMKKIHTESHGTWTANRVGGLLHTTWDRVLTDNLHQIFGTTAGKRYAILGGIVHGTLLQEYIPELITYALDKGLQFREYDDCEIDAQGLPMAIWAF